ncbi:hypothetical protein Mlute_02918 [Meiothermus luteus]|uniref:Uncharacterized protein n=1 Tax=Meiothermus luteus TaxID=2026184 RepID=A0A399E9F9_9DEIN|nr:hypothetical protein Mlute_02918 [Meiothermus luteus]
MRSPRGIFFTSPAPRSSSVALDLWWPRVERHLPFLTRRYEVRFYPDGSRAVVCADLEALKVWYKRLLKG